MWMRLEKTDDLRCILEMRLARNKKRRGYEEEIGVDEWRDDIGRRGRVIKPNGKCVRNKLMLFLAQRYGGKKL